MHILRSITRTARNGEVQYAVGPMLDVKKENDFIIHNLLPVQASINLVVYIPYI